MHLHAGTVSQPYRMTLFSVGAGPVTWSIDGELPQGLSFSEPAVITAWYLDEGVKGEPYDFKLTSLHDVPLTSGEGTQS